MPIFFQKKLDGQAKYFGSVAGLNAVALALTGITSDDGKVSTRDGENCAAIFCVRVELPLLRVCDSGHVRHFKREECGGICRKEEGRRNKRVAKTLI